MFKKVTRKGSKNGAKVPKFKAPSNCNISSQKQAFDKLSKAKINYYTCSYEVCSKKIDMERVKMGQKYQNLRQLQTAISQARNRLLTNFQRLESTTIHGHMVCVQKSDMVMTKK